MDNRQKKFFLLLILLGGCFAVSYINNFVGNKQQNDFIAVDNSVQKSVIKGDNSKNTLKVYVSGAVVKPGVYNLHKEDRALQAVEIAGGFLDDADLEKTNLVRKLKDGCHINVPYKKGKNKQGKKNLGNIKNTKEKNIIENTNTMLIKINTASRSQLESLPGIGPSLAERIIEYRRQHRFSKAEDLLQVKGIGKNKLAKIRAYLDFN